MDLALNNLQRLIWHQTRQTKLKSHWSLYVSFSITDAGLCIYHLFVWSSLNFLRISLGHTLPPQSCLVLAIWPILDDLFVSQNPKEISASHFSRLRFVHIPLVGMVKFKFLAQFSMNQLLYKVVNSLFRLTSVIIVIIIIVVLVVAIIIIFLVSYNPSHSF